VASNAPAIRDLTAHVDFTRCGQLRRTKAWLTLDSWDQTYFVLGLVHDRAGAGDEIAWREDVMDERGTRQHAIKWLLLEKGGSATLRACADSFARRVT